MIGSFVAQPREKKERQKKKERVSKVMGGGGENRAVG
jgi:hypothetical protein